MESRDSGQFSYHSKISQDLQVISGDKTESITQLKASPNFNQKLIGTHSEVFHCDDVLACTMLLYTKEFSNSIIVRTRNENTFPHLDILVDVGSVFDPGNYRFDHHQRSFDTTWWDDMKDKQEEQPHCKIKLSSAGLVYKFFGKDVIQNILKDVFNTTLEEPYFNNLYEKLYQTFMIEIDALDNGVNQGKDLAYQIRTGLGMRVSRLNKAWNDNSSTTFNDQFKKAMRITEEELLWQIYSISQILIPARKMVQEAWNSKEKFHQNGQFLHIETACPWKQHLFEIEKELDQEGLIKFVFYKDTRGMYRVQAVPQINSEFENRISLHIDWRGLRGEELQQKSGFKDIDFVHHSGFIGGAWSLETVISMAERSLEEVSKDKPENLKS